MKHIWERKKPSAQPTGTHDARGSERRAITVPGRISWKDQRGIDRFASVVTRDVSDAGIFVESRTALSIPLYRLVRFEIEPGARATSDLPEILRSGGILTAVYRILHPGAGASYGIALRLMVAPKITFPSCASISPSHAS